MNETELIKIFADKINLLKNNSISIDELLTDPLINQALELAPIATYNHEAKQEKEALKISKKQGDNSLNGKLKNMGCAWTLTARLKLITQFNSNTPLHVIANDIERTIGSIEYQLVKEGLMKEEDTTYNKNKQSKPSHNNSSNQFNNSSESSNTNNELPTLTKEDYPF